MFSVGFALDPKYPPANNLKKIAVDYPKSHESYKYPSRKSVNPARNVAPFRAESPAGGGTLAMPGQNRRVARAAARTGPWGRRLRHHQTETRRVDDQDHQTAGH